MLGASYSFLLAHFSFRMGLDNLVDFTGSWLQVEPHPYLPGLIPGTPIRGAGIPADNLCTNAHLQEDFLTFLNK